MTNRFVAIVLAVWMSSAALVAVVASAAPPHVVGGGLFDATGQAGSANAAEFVFYSTNQPGYPLLTGADSLTPGNPAIWGEDVGSSWNWQDGDLLVAVAETRRGVNGWPATSQNYTSSIDGTLRVGPSVQDFGNGTLEAIPTVTGSSGADYIILDWTSLTDGNGNVVSYEVFHSTTPSGFVTAVARIPHGGAVSTNQSGLSPGMHCYAVGVNYRRDTGSGVYTTTGLSEPVCTTVVDVAPRVIQTTPVDGVAGVAVNAQLVVEFSEPMNTGTVSVGSAPSVGPFTYFWTNGDRTVTVSHTTDFATCMHYTMTVVGNDLTGNPLGPGPVPNPFDFWAFCPAPSITSTTPISGAIQVRTDSAIIIRFSEPMVRTTVVFTISPALANSSAWNAANDTLTITPSGGFAEGVVYTVNVVQGQDVDSNNLVAGPAANPWSFTTNRKPTVTIDPTLSDVCVAGGSSLVITWTMSDAETATSSLLVTLSVTGVINQVIAGPTAGILSFTWSTPSSVNGVVQVLIEVEDTPAQERANDNSGAVTIDSTAPTVSSFTPLNGAQGVALNVVVQIRFSEAMNTAVTWGAITIGGAISGAPTPVWSTGDTVLNITAGFQGTTTYTITIGAGAKDACGVALGTPTSWQFVTGAGTKVPNRPTGLTASAAVNAITLTWTRPTTYSDNSIFQATDVQVYVVLRATSADVNTSVQVGLPTAASFTDTTVQPGVRYYYWVKVRDTQGRESAVSDPIDVLSRSPPDTGFPWLLLLIPLIVILLIVGIWLMRGRKPGAAPPPPQAAPRGPSGGMATSQPQEAPPEEIPAEEPASQSGGDFIACPNCGTMVKPTDAECFVCGAKL